MTDPSGAGPPGALEKAPVEERKAPIIEGITKLAAVLGSLVAVGQATSTWIDGAYKAKAEQEKTVREVKLADIKEKSALAESYLKLVLSKETPLDGRAILLSALGELEGHPLQNWARGRYKQYQQYNKALEEAYRAQSDAAQHVNEADGRVNALKLDIAALNVQIKQNLDNAPKLEELQKQRIAKSSELAKASATRSVASAVAEATSNFILRTISRTDPTLAPLERTGGVAIRSVTDRVDAALLKSVFPPQAGKNIDGSVQYLRAALQEFKISDPRMIAAILSTIAVETPNFEVYEESAAAGAKYEGRLGNAEAGDGVKFRGRGYIGLTGKANYKAMSTRLGLGSRLVDSPDDAKSPEVASRILVAWFADRQDQLLQALEQNNLSVPRRMVVGGVTHLERFSEVYRKLLPQLMEPRKEANAAATPTK